MTTSLLRAAAVGACALLSATASRAVPFEFQGTIRAITPMANGSVQLVCGTVPTVVTLTTAITTPTRKLTLAQLVDSTAFPASGFSGLTGLPRAGFVGTTCVAIGDDTTVPGQNALTTLSLEIEENSLIGATAGGQGGYDIRGTRATPILDERMAATRPAAGFYAANGIHASAGVAPATAAANGLTETARNGFGFGVDLATVPVGDLGAADGYYGTDGQFYFHTLETTGGTPLRTEPRPSIQRASCLNDAQAGKDRVELRGGCVIPATATTATVTLEGLLANGTYQTYGTATCTAAAGAAPSGAGYAIGLYVYRNAGLTLTNNACPSSMRARTTTAGTTRYDFATPDAR